MEEANHGYQEEGRVKTQNREWEKRWKERQVADGKNSDAMMLLATTCNIWDTIKQFHPYKKEILNVVSVLNKIGASLNIIAATLDLKRWKTFYGDGEWTDEDIKDILEK